MTGKLLINKTIVRDISWSTTDNNGLSTYRIQLEIPCDIDSNQVRTTGEMAGRAWIGLSNYFFKKWGINLSFELKLAEYKSEVDVLHCCAKVLIKDAPAHVVSFFKERLGDNWK